MFINQHNQFYWEDSIAGFFDESYYLKHKADQLAKSGINDADGKPYTADTLKSALSDLGLSPEDHYKAYGSSEKLNPNPYFNEVEYLAAKKAQLAESDPSWATKTVEELRDALNATGMTAAEHYEKYGAFEANSKGVLLNPSNAFDANAYFAAKLVELKSAGVEGADTMTVAQVVEFFKESGMSPVTHYEAHGATEATQTQTPLVQTVPSEQRVPNDPARTENVPGNYNPPTVGAASPDAAPAPVAKPADMGGKVPAEVSPIVTSPTKPLPVPGDSDYVKPPSTLVDTNEKPVVPPSDATNGNWAQVDPDTGAADLIKPDGKPGGTLPPGSFDPEKPIDPSVPPTPSTPENPGGGGGTTAPVLTVEYSDETATPAKAIISFNIDSDVTVTKPSADYVLTPKEGDPVTLKSGFTSGTFVINEHVTLHAASSLLDGKSIEKATGVNAGKVELTDFATGHVLSGIASDLTVKATLGGDVTYNDTNHGTIDAFVVAGGKKFTVADSVAMDDKILSGAGAVELTTGIVSDDVTINASGMTGAVTAAFTEGSAPHTLTYNGGSGVDKLTLAAKASDGDYSNMKLIANLGAGDDVINVGIGANGISFAAGSTLNGGDGTDTLEITGTVPASGTLKFADNSLTSIEKIDLSPLTNTHTASLDLSNQSTAFTVTGSSGSDNITGGSGGDYIDGGNGNDTLIGGGGADWLFGGSGDDTMWAGATDDDGSGSAPNADSNSLFLTIFNNSTSTATWLGSKAFGAVSNANILEGREGDDQLHASSGKDVFLYQTGGTGANNDRTDELDLDDLGNDTITGFTVGTDKILFMDQDSKDTTGSATTGARDFSAGWTFGAVDASGGTITRFTDDTGQTFMFGGSAYDGSGAHSSAEIYFQKGTDTVITIAGSIVQGTAQTGETLTITLTGVDSSAYTTAAQFALLFGANSAA